MKMNEVKLIYFTSAVLSGGGVMAFEWLTRTHARYVRSAG